jgi:(p)ppGpp synthase/HD superfamily hydrolase
MLRSRAVEKMSMLERAVAIASEAHIGQIDKAGAPYLLHPLRLMFQMETTEDRIVAVLHDVVEDSDWSLECLRREGFSQVVIEAVDSVTRRNSETYEEFVLGAAQNPTGRRVKLADLRDNCDLNRIANPTEKDLERIAKYKNATMLLEGKAQRPAPYWRLKMAVLPNRWQIRTVPGRNHEP